MATAVKKEMKAEPPPYEVTLTLSQEEAQALYSILGWRVLGNGMNSPRKFLDDIYYALEKAGVSSDKFHVFMKGQVTCTEFK